MKGFEVVEIQKYLVVENKKLKVAEMLISILMFIVLIFIGAATNVIYYQSYVVGSPFIAVARNFETEAKLNNDLYQAAEADFIYYPSSDWIFIPKR